MNKRFLTFLVVVVACSSVVLAEEVRTWTDSSGSFTIEASLPDDDKPWGRNGSEVPGGQISTPGATGNPNALEQDKRHGTAGCLPGRYCEHVFSDDR